MLLELILIFAALPATFWFALLHIHPDPWVVYVFTPDWRGAFILIYYLVAALCLWLTHVSKGQ